MRHLVNTSSPTYHHPCTAVRQPFTTTTWNHPPPNNLESPSPPPPPPASAASQTSDRLKASVNEMADEIHDIGLSLAHLTASFGCTDKGGDDTASTPSTHPKSSSHPKPSSHGAHPHDSTYRISVVPKTPCSKPRVRTHASKLRSPPTPCIDSATATAAAAASAAHAAARASAATGSHASVAAANAACNIISISGGGHCGNHVGVGVGRELSISTEENSSSTCGGGGYAGSSTTTTTSGTAESPGPRMRSSSSRRVSLTPWTGPSSDNGITDAAVLTGRAVGLTLGRCDSLDADAACTIPELLPGAAGKQQQHKEVHNLSYVSRGLTPKSPTSNVWQGPRSQLGRVFGHFPLRDVDALLTSSSPAESAMQLREHRSGSSHDRAIGHGHGIVRGGSVASSTRWRTPLDGQPPPMLTGQSMRASGASLPGNSGFQMNWP